jgi:Ribonuclease G/E
MKTSKHTCPHCGGTIVIVSAAFNSLGAKRYLDSYYKGQKPRTKTAQQRKAEQRDREALEAEFVAAGFPPRKSKGSGEGSGEKE